MESTALQPQTFDRQKIDLIKQTVAKGATDLELQLFFHACQRTGLDPLMKQIYAIKRWSSADKREVMSIQTGIDGYRLIADRTGQYGGSDEPMYETDGEKLTKATVTVVKLVKDMPCRFTASARWEEYVQTNRDGQPTSMWKKMPYLMLAKCAEALALRKAFPAELSGVYTHEEMMQADMEPRTINAPIEEQQGAAPAARVEGDKDGEPTGQSFNGASANTDAPPPPTDPQDYISKIKLSESVRECSQVLNDVLSDEGLSAQDRKALQTLGKQKMQEFQRK